MTCFYEIQLLQTENWNQTLKWFIACDYFIHPFLNCVLFTRAAKVWSSLGCGVARDRHGHPAARDLGRASVRRRDQIMVNIPGASYLNWKIGLINILDQSITITIVVNLPSQHPTQVAKMMATTQKAKVPKSWKSVSGLLPLCSLGESLDSDSESRDISRQSLKILTISRAVDTKPDTQPAIEEDADCWVSRKVILGSWRRLDPCRLNLPAWSTERTTLHQDMMTFLKLEHN